MTNRFVPALLGMAPLLATAACGSNIDTNPPSTVTGQPAPGVTQPTERPVTPPAAQPERADQSPANPNATADAKRLLSSLYALKSRSNKRVLVGQNIGHIEYKLAEGYQSFFRQLTDETGKTPTIMAVDYGYEPPSATNYAAANNLLVQHCAAGGLVSISIHPKNPFTGGNVDDRSTGGKPFRDIITEGTETRARWMETMNAVADGLEQLRDANVTVLWRPLHEMNGAWFWWNIGPDGEYISQEDFTAVWQDMFTYFTEERGLDNLLWVYAPNVQVDPELKPSDYYYPGSEFVDVVGLDYYRNDLSLLNAGGSYDRLVPLGKPFGLAEVGPANWAKAHPKGRYDTTQVTAAIQEEYSELVFFTFWHGWQNRFRRAYSAIVENQNADSLMSDPMVVTLEDATSVLGTPTCK